MARSRYYHDTDPFTFMVETIDRDGLVIDVLAGSENIYAARAAFQALVDSYRPDIRLSLRHGGRIMVKSNGKATNVVPFGPNS